jgi:hypothetical protein
MPLHPGVLDPLKFAAKFWPQWPFYDKQVEVIYSVEDNPETVCPAGNKLGKDFVAGFIAPSFLIRYSALGTVRVVTTSVKDDHLRVLWGEIGRFLDTAAIPLTNKKRPDLAGVGPLVVNHRDIRIEKNGVIDKISYLRGMVSERGEGLAGHHADFTLCIGDEASGLDEQVYSMAQGWAKRMLWIGNPNPCANFFRRGVKDGDLVAT